MDQYNYNQVAVLRDEQVAQEIRSMAALGKFPKELTAYGLVYYHNGQRHYMISADQTKLIYFLNDITNQRLFPTLIDSYSERMAIPEGFEEDAIHAVKLKLAQKLQKDYPVEVFTFLEELYAQEPNNSAEEALWQSRRQLECVFHTEKIRAFAALCTRAYWRKNMTRTAYQQLNDWCTKRLNQLEAHIPPVGKREKGFYGLAVIHEQQIKRCVVNANLSCIYQEKLSLEAQGFLTSIWHKKHFDMPKQEGLYAISAQMTQFLEDIYDESILALIEAIEQAPSAIDEQRFWQLLGRMKTLGEKTEKLGRYYGQNWGINCQRVREKL